MKNLKPFVWTVVALSAMGVGAGLALSAGAMARNAAPPASAVIAKIDIEKVVAGMDERGALEKQLDDQKNTFLNELKDAEAKLKDAKDKADKLPDGPDRTAQIEKVALMGVDLTIKEQYYDGVMGQRKARLQMQLFNKIVEATKKIAEQNKITIVISSDDAATLPPGAKPETVANFASMRRFVYVAPEHDITADVIALLNNEFKIKGK
jgi:Skp family chaperone for outer membrane proteins